MKNPLESIRTGLVSQLAELDRDLAATAAQVTHLKLSRQKIAAALRALGSDDMNPGLNSPVPNRPAPKPTQVARAVAELEGQLAATFARE